MKVIHQVVNPNVIDDEAGPIQRIPPLASMARGTPDRPDALIVSSDPGQSDDGIRHLGRALSMAIGRLLPQDAEGALERDVFDRNIPDGPVRYSSSSEAAPMHTDGMHMPDQHVPEYFSLTCLHPAASGGTLAFVRLSDVLRRLTGLGEADHAIHVLSGDFWFHTKGVGPRGERAVRRPVVEPGDDGYEIQYAREYIDLAHALPDVPDLGAEQLKVLDRLDQTLADQSLWRKCRLVRGDIALVDNRRVLHSRSAFVDDSALPKRRMMRLWIQRR